VSAAHTAEDVATTVRIATESFLPGGAD